MSYSEKKGWSCPLKDFRGGFEKPLFHFRGNVTGAIWDRSLLLNGFEHMAPATRTLTVVSALRIAASFPAEIPKEKGPQD